MLRSVLSAEKPRKRLFTKRYPHGTMRPSCGHPDGGTDEGSGSGDPPATAGAGLERGAAGRLRWHGAVSNLADRDGQTKPQRREPGEDSESAAGRGGGPFPKSPSAAA